MFTVCGHMLAEGEKRQVVLKPTENYEMPATIIAGCKPGKTVLVTAGIHAGEYPGIPAVIHIAGLIDPKTVCGNIVMIHCVNTSGFWARTDSILPEDNGNLNADYPGCADGTITQRIAHWFVTELFPHMDFVIDLHSGSIQEPLTPCLFFPKWEKVREASLAAAKVTTIPYLIQSMAKTGEYSYAAHTMGIPGLLLERGHSGLCEKEWIEGYVRDLKLLLAHLGCCFSGESFAVEKHACDGCDERHVFVKTIYQEAEENGVWYCNVKVNEPVKKGDLLGRTEDFFGNVLHEYHAQADGVVFYHCAGLSVKKGRNLVAYGIETE